MLRASFICKNRVFLPFPSLQASQRYIRTRAFPHPEADVVPTLEPLQPLQHQDLATKPTKEVIDFSNAEAAFKSKSLVDLLRSYVVLRSCSFEPLLVHCDALINKSYHYLGRRLTNLVIKNTFFKHFCGGEDTHDLQPTLAHLAKYNVSGILDYAAECDLEAAPVKEQKATADDIDEFETTAEPVEGVISARVYDYEGEAECDKNADIFLKSIETVSKLPLDSFAAIKVTALGKPELLERMSTVLTFIDVLFDKFDINKDKEINLGEFSFGLSQLGVELSASELKELFSRFDPDGKGCIDYVDWTTRLELTNTSELSFFLDDKYESTIVNQNNPEGAKLKDSMLSREDLKLVESMVKRINRVAQAAKEADVKLMVDAEHTYLQPAIHHVTLNLQRKYNKDKPLIFNTYQCYLKNSEAAIRTDLVRSQRDDFYFAAKLVRGAYLVLESNRAKKLGIECPIFDVIEDTHNNYNAMLDLCLQNINKASIMIASHNRESIELAAQKMQEYSINPKTGGVYFGQLLGMSDHLTFNLGSKGYGAFKYIPYGPVDKVIPYLVRRVHENADLILKSKSELELMRKEIFNRVIPGRSSSLNAP